VKLSEVANFDKLGTKTSKLSVNKDSRDSSGISKFEFLRFKIYKEIFEPATQLEVPQKEVISPVILAMNGLVND